MNALLRLAPLALVLALGIVLAGWAQPAGATPTSLTVNGSSAASTQTLNTAVPVLATYTDEGTGGFTLFSTAANNVGYFLPGATLTQNSDGQTLAGNDPTMATSVTVTEDADATSESTQLQAFFFCIGAGTTQIYFTQGGGASSQISVTCGAGGTSTVSVSPTSAAIGGAATVTGTCTAASQPLVATTGGYFTTTPSNGTYVSTQQVNCISAGTVTATFYCSTTATVTFTLNGATAYLTCGSGSTSITVSPTTVALNAAASVTGTCTAAGQGLIATGGAGYFTTTASNGTYVSTTQINCAAAGSIVATFYCQGNATETFSLNGATGTLYCGSTSGAVSLNPATGTGTTITGTCVTGTLLTQTGPASITSAALNGQYLTTGIAAGSVSCSTSGTLTATLTCNSAGNVYITLGTGSATFVCSAGASSNPYGSYNPYNTNPYASNNCGYSVAYCPNQTVGASALTVSASASSVSCGGSSSITVAVKGANGAAAADGTSVSLSSTAGTVSPSTATTSGGTVQALFNAPSSGSATASITASAGSATGSTSVSVSCSPVVTSPAVAPPSAPPAGAPRPPVISPPSTGDAGLKANDGDFCIDAAVTAP